MSEIRNTITTVLAQNGVNADDYSREVDIVAGALEEREYTIREKIENITYERGYGEYAEEILSETGMMKRPAPEPEAPALTEEEAANPGLAAVLSKLNELGEKLTSVNGTVDKLVSAAERNGIRL